MVILSCAPVRAATIATPGVGVTDHTSAVGPIYTFDYALTNTTVCTVNCTGTTTGHSIPGYILALREFAVPYFTDAAITAITAPMDWTWHIVATDLFNLGHSAEALVWDAQTETAGIALGATLDGFGFQSTFGPGKGPFQGTLGGGGTIAGDPAIPLSPNAIAAGILPLDVPSVPEPATLALLALALFGVGALRSKNTLAA